MSVRAPKVVKALSKLLHEENAKVLTAHLAWSDPATRARDTAAWALGNMMPEAAPAMSEMVAGLAWPPLSQKPDFSDMGDSLGIRLNNYLRLGVVDGLVCAGETSIPVLKAALESQDDITRRGAVHAVFSISNHAHDLLSTDHLFLALEDPVTAVCATNELESRNALAGALPHVESLLKSPNSKVRDNALTLLQKLGSGGQAAVPWVIAAMNNIDKNALRKPGIRNLGVSAAYGQMLYTLGFIGQGSIEAKEAVVDALESPGPEHKRAISSIEMLFSDPPDIWREHR